MTQMSVELKQPSSLINPMIRINDSKYNKDWNYCYIPSWGRYYFIHNATISNGLVWEVELAIDVLASWKSAISSASAYVSRSESHYDNKLPDSTWSHNSDITLNSQTIELGWSTGGTYVLFTASNEVKTSATAIPAVSPYGLSAGSLAQITSYLFSNDFFSAVTDGLDDTNKILSQQFFNPFQYITKCMWFPFSLSDITGANSTIKFGWWDSGITGKLLTGNKWSKSVSFTLGTYTDWTDRDASWTNITLYVPCFGQIPISTDFVGLTLTLEIVVDMATGEGGLFIKNGTNLVASATGHVGAQIQLSSLYEDIIGDLGSKASAVVTGVKAIGGAVSNIVSGAKDILTGVTDLSKDNIGQLAKDAVEGAQSALQPTRSTIGASGAQAITQTESDAILTITKFARYEDIHTRLGGMCNKIYTLSQLSGYTEVVNPHIYCNATSGEISMINAFLSGGFYLE